MSGRVTRVLFYALVAGFVVFFALTRTEVGREGLRAELERQFSRSFEGELAIRELTGNLLNRLSAGGVVVRDSSGRPALTIDSVIVHPSWRDLFSRTLSTGRITLIEPEVHLARDAAGDWNVRSFLKERIPSTERDPWSFRATQVQVIRGRVVTQNAGNPPPEVERGILFDYANAEVRGINGRAIIDWGSELKLIDVLEFEGRLPQLGLDLDSLRGQFVLDGGSVSVNEAHLDVGSSSIHLTGSVASLRELREQPAKALVELDVIESRFDGAELSRIFPALPLRDALTASIRVQGPLAGLVVEDFVVARGTSVMSAEGTALGLPDSLDYDLALRPSTIHWTDLQSVWPSTSIPNFEHLGQVSLSGFSAGILQFARGGARTLLEGIADIQLESRAGLVSAESRLRLGGEPWLGLEGAVDASNLDLGMVLRRGDLASNLNGRLTLDLEGPDLRGASGDAALALSRSRMAARSVDSLIVSAAGSMDDFQGSMAAIRGNGTLHADLAMHSQEGGTFVRVDGQAWRLNIGEVLVQDSLHSSIDARFTLSARGASLASLEGDLALAFDSSRIAYRDTERSIPPHRTRISLRQVGSNDPHLSVSGDVLDIDVTGDVAIVPFTRLARLWSESLMASFEQERSKFYRPVHEETNLALDPILVQDASMIMRDAGLTTQRMTARVRVLREDIVAAFLPKLPQLESDGVAEIDLAFDDDHFELVTRVDADLIRFGSAEASDLDLSFRISASSRGDLVEHLTSNLEIASSELSLGRQRFIAPTLRAAVNGRAMSLDARAESPGTVRPFRLAATMDLLDDRNRLTVSELQLAANDQAWTMPDSSVINVYGDGMVVEGIRIERADPDSASHEGVFIAGNLSSAPGDTLLVDVKNIRLQHVSSMLSLENPVGGAINGRLAFTGLNRRPELTGHLEVMPLTYENRVLGTLSVSSRYIPGSPDIGLDVRLRPDADVAAEQRIEPNDLALSGAFRLPAGVGRSRDAGSLDISLDVDRADAFFFDYLFKGVVSEVDGYLAGTGHIGGDFAKPLFDAQLELHDGSFRIPEFGLDYSAAGPVHVDEKGIHLHEVGLQDPTGGEALVGGSILFNDYRFFSFDLHGHLDGIRIMNVSQSRDLPFYGRIWSSGDVRLTGPLSSATLHSNNASTTRESDLYIPITATDEGSDEGFIVFADSTGRLPDISRLIQRRSVLAARPHGERPFLDGLEIDLNISAPQGSTVHLVIDPLLGDVINAVGSGRIQLVRDEGEFSTFGSFDVSSGDYLFTAGEVFFRRFLIDSGSITWDGDPLNAVLGIAASYRTRASTDGLGLDAQPSLIPIVIRMNVMGRVATPSVDLALDIDRDERSMMAGYESSIEALLNQPEHAAQYATSVLLTNSFLLTTSAQSQLADTRNQLAFNSLSQLVASQLNRYLNYALPNIDLNLGVQGESTQDLDVTYGVALRLLDERLIIRGEGIYRSDDLQRTQQGVLDEFVVEVRLNPSVSVEVFYRREGDILDAQTLNTNTTGAGLSYQTEFSTWRHLVRRLFGWIVATDDGENPDAVAGAAN